MRDRVDWQDGMLVSAADFQRQERYQQQYESSTWQALFGHQHFGVIELLWDEGALAQSRLSLRRCLAIFPNGRVLDYDAQYDEPIGLSLTFNKSMQQIVLQIEDSLGDEISLIAEESLSLNQFQLCVGQISKVDALGVHLNIQFCADILLLHTSGELLVMVKKLLSAMCARQQELFHQLSNIESANAIGLREWLVWQLLNREIAHLDNGMNRQWLLRDCYDYLRTLNQQLSALVSPSDEAKPYEFSRGNVFPIFNSLIASCQSHLLQVWRHQAVQIPLQNLSTGYFSAQLDAQIKAASTWIIAIDAPLDAEGLSTLSAHIKVAAKANVQNLVYRQLPGVPLTVLAHTPKEMPFHAHRSYLALDTSSPVWQSVLQEGFIVVYLPESLSDIQWTLWAIPGEQS